MESLSKESLTSLPGDAPVYPKRTFVLFCLIQAMVNFDSGAIPAVLDDLQSKLGMDELGLGALGALPYFALTIMSPIAGILLSRYSPRNFITISLFLNLLCTTLLASSKYPWMLFLSRFCIGLTQSSFLIYAPVWVEEFAHAEWKTTWLAILQAAVPLGVTFGYLVSGLMSGAGVLWNWAIAVQCFILLPLVALFYFIPRKPEPEEMKLADNLKFSDSEQTSRGEEIPVATSVPDVESSVPTEESAAMSSNDQENGPAATLVLNSSGSASFVVQLKGLLNGVYISTIFGLSALFFVVSGLQFWATVWFMDLGQEKEAVVLTFGSVAVSAPIVGVLVGGCLVDKCGGYGPDPNQQRKAIRILFILAALAAICAIGASYTNVFVPVVILLWFVLFFGGAILPAATGIMLTSIPPQCKSLASGFGQGVYNIFGFALGILLPGAVMKAVATESKATAEDRLVGIRVMLFWSLCGVVGIGLSYFFVGTARKWGDADSNTSKPVQMKSEAQTDSLTSRSITVDLRTTR